MINVLLEKRWRDRAQRWVAPGELFRPWNFTVACIEYDQARRFVLQYHYSGSYPASRLEIGLFHHTTLVGVAVFSVGMNQATVPKYSGFRADQGCELGRFVCDPTVKFNGESWFLARAIKLLSVERSELRVFVSYADPIERRHGDLLVKAAHWGTIYQASNAVYAGRSSARTQLVAPDGSIISGRALSKIRNEECGWRYATTQLLRAGAPPRLPHEDLRRWVDRIMVSDQFTKVRHPGNLAYVFGLDRNATLAIKTHNNGGLPYIKGDLRAA